MKGMVLAAGFGKRLQPLTRVLPKPMFPVLGRPILSHIFDLLISASITEIAVNIHHLPESIVNYCKREKPSGLELHFSREEKILGTAGGIKKMEKFLKDGPFILINSDIITDISLREVIDFHKKNNSKLTLVVRKDISPEKYDSIEICKDGRIVHFIGASPKSIPERTTRVMFTGIQIMEPEIFDRIPPNQFCGTTEDIFPQMVREGIPVYGYLYEGYWKDMGNRENYLQANSDALSGKVKLRPIPSHAPNGPIILQPVLIGHDCHVSKSSQIGPYAVIGPNCKVESGAKISNSIIWEGAQLGVDSVVTHSVVAQNGVIEKGENINEESII